MKTKLQSLLMAFFLFLMPGLNFGQAPDLKTCADFILFSSSGGITNTGVSQILGGAVGTNFGALTGFENVNCVKHIADAVTAQCKLDLQAVYDEISAILPTAVIPAASLSGGTLTPGIYQINSAAAITINLTLDAQNNPDAIFIFKVNGAISTAASVGIILQNGASVNNIFWHGNAAISAGAGAFLKGTFMTNAGAIALGAGATLEGRALTVIGEITMSGSTLTGCLMAEATTVTLTQPTYWVATGTIEVTAPLGPGISYSIDGADFSNTSGLFTLLPGGEYTVMSKNSEGCISWTDVTLVSYVHVPTLGTAADFILFSSSGGITNAGVSQILGGAIGTDFGALTGFEDVNCVKHIQNAETAQCKLDLQAVYDEISAIEATETLIAANVSGSTITPGIYQINSALDLTIDLTLDAQGNPDALFIFKVTGAFSMAASVNILLINGASVNNVFWHGTAAIGVGAGASMKGIFMTNAGAIALGAGASLEGRALTMIGEVTISGSTLIGCLMPEATLVTLTQPTCSVATGTIEITAPLGEGMTYSIDGTDFTNTSGLFTKVPGGDYIVTAKNTDGCLSMTNITLIGFPHPPELGTVTDFVLFTSAGAVGNTGVSTITGGAIGTDFGAITGFETIECEKHIADDATAQCKLDLQAAFDEINAYSAETITAASLNGGTLTHGIYHINSAAALAIDLTLDAENNPDALFIFKITGAFSMAAAVDIILINGATVNNVFWNVDGAVSAGAGASMKGTFLALAGTISLGAGASLEGRALSIAGAITIYNSDVSVCIKPPVPVITVTQPTCSVPTGTIEVTAPTGTGMTYRIDYCEYTNTTGIFTDLLEGTYLVTAKDSEGCISDATIAIINETPPPMPTVNAGADMTVCESENVHLAATAANYSTLLWITTGDGTFDDPTILNPTYTPGPLDIANGSSELCLTAYPIDPCTTASSSCMNLMIQVCQHSIQIGTGWSGISSFIDPDNPDMSAVLSPIIANLILLYDFNGMYWPAGAIFTLPIWDTFSGYVIKVSNSAELSISGIEIENKTVNLVQGWNLIPVLSSAEYNIQDLFIGVDGFVVAKEVAGTGIYWKDYAINSIGDVEPGKAYYVRMNTSGSIDYSIAVKNSFFGKPANIPPLSSPWNDVVHTPVSHLVAFNVDDRFQAGDIIGGFTSEGKCAGSVEITDPSIPFAINLNGDDVFSSEKEGFEAGELLIYKLLRQSTGETFYLSVTYDSALDHSGLFGANGLSAVTDVIMSATNIASPSQQGLGIYPNPSEGAFTIEGIYEKINVRICNALGEEIYHSELNLPAKIDLSAQTRGMYFIKVETDNRLFFDKLVIN